MKTRSPQGFAELWVTNSYLKDEIDLKLSENGKWEFTYNCLEVVAIKREKSSKDELKDKE